MANVFISSNNMNMDEVAITMEELSDRFVIYGKITGVINNNININYNGEYITVNYTRAVQQSAGNQWTNINIQQSKTENKNFYVPNMDPTKLTATYENEMLNIIIMKNEVEEGNSSEIVEIVDVDDFYDVEESTIE